MNVTKSKIGVLGNMKNRSDIEVMASILRSAIGSWQYKTTIMNTATVSHSQLVRYLAIAVDRGMIEYSSVTGLYKTASPGLIFLDKYEQLLLLLPSISDLPELVHTTAEGLMEEQYAKHNK
jgi:predicted transcriptional regulator